MSLYAKNGRVARCCPAKALSTYLQKAALFDSVRTGWNNYQAAGRMFTSVTVAKFTAKCHIYRRVSPSRVKVIASEPIRARWQGLADQIPAI
jgi:hypothetical protein